MEALVVQSAALLLLSLTLSVNSEGTYNEPACYMYGIGEVSECTTGFASLYHIDEAEGNTDLKTNDRRQVVIPDIHFRCSGTVRKWIIGAKWAGNSAANAYTELQIWRRSSGSVYTKVGSTTIMVGAENASQLYEYPLETPLAFQEGDIFGYFQPRRNVSELRLYLEDSSRLITYVDSMEAPQNYFNISASSDRDDRYPLIGIGTDPQGCGCGFMTLERMYRLLGITMTTGGGARTSGTGRQFIFPDIGFTCSGKVVKWIVGGRWSRNERGDYSQLQIWRPSGNGVYHRLNGTTISTAVERGNNVYEFIADPPIPFRSGDIVGVFQPQRSKLRVDYDTEGGSLIYHISVGSDEVMSSHITIDTSDGNLRTATALPFVSVEIAAMSTTTASSQDLVVQQSTTSPLDTYLKTTSVQATLTATPSVIVSHSPSHSEYGGDSSDGASIDPLSVGMGVAGALLVLIIAPVIIIAVLVCLRKNNKLNTTNDVAYLPSNTALQTNVAEIQMSQDYSYPYISSSMDPLYTTPDEVCNDHNSSSEVTDTCIPTSTNPAYHKGGNNVAYLPSSTALQTNMAEIHTSQDYSYPYTSSSMDPLCTTPDEVYDDHTSSSELTDTCISTSTNPAYHKGGKDSPALITDILTASNQAYLEDGPIYEDADIPTSTNQSYQSYLEEGLYQADGDTLTCDSAT